MRHKAHRLAAAIVSSAVVLLSAAIPASAAAPGPSISISPVGTNRAYFTETMDPGTTRQLSVALVNHGTTAATATTYAADVYTIVDGGFGARLRGQPETGVTTWISYPSSSVELPAGGDDLRTFTVSVPATAAPGEHITSLVVEEPEQTGVGGELSLDQVTRQALPIVIDVPGPRLPGLVIGAATASAVGGRTVVAVQVTNSGNVREHPAGQILVTGPDHHETSFHVAMATVYPGDTTTVTAAFPDILPAGLYTLSLNLADAVVGVRAKRDGIALQVRVPPPVIPAAPTVGSQTTTGGERPSEPTAPGVLIAALVVGSLIAGAGMAAGAAAIRRRRSGKL